MFLQHFPNVYDEKDKGGLTSPVKPFYDHSNLAKAAPPHGFREIFLCGASRVSLRQRTQFAHTCASAVGIAAIILFVGTEDGGKGGRAAKNHEKLQARLACNFCEH